MAGKADLGIKIWSQVEKRERARERESARERERERDLRKGISEKGFVTIIMKRGSSAV